MKTDLDKISDSIKAAQKQLGLGAEAAAKHLIAATSAMREMRVDPKKIDLAKIFEKKQLKVKAYKTAFGRFFIGQN